LLLGLVLAIGLGGVFGAYVWRKHQRVAAAQEQRRLGMEAVARGDHALVLDHLGAYLKTRDDDVEALYSYAKARRIIEEPRSKHLVQAIGVLQRVVDLAPGHAEAQQALLELYTGCGYNHETLDLAKVLIAKGVFEADAWRSIGVALARLRQPEQALAAVEKCLLLRPNDLRAGVLWFDLLQQRGATAADLIEAADAYGRKRPGAPNVDLVQAYAYRLAGDNARLQQSLKSAAARVPPDDEHTVLLVTLLDHARLGEDALSVLDRATAKIDSSRIRGELVRRWWENNRYLSIADRLAPLDASRRDIDGEQLGFRAAALFELGRREEAGAIVDHLAARGPDSLGAAWANVLRSVYQSAQRSPRAVISACRDGLAMDPGNAYFGYLQGAAWWSLGESDLALQAWRLAIKQRPDWLSPRICCVHALLAAGQLDIATREASAALQRSPSRVDALVAWVMARAAGLAPDDTAGARELLAPLASVQKAMPFEPNTLVLQVSLLAQAGDAEGAAARLKQALNEAPALDEAICLRLASISRIRGLKLQDACFEKLEKSGGMTPGLALAKAHQLADAGRAEAGKRLLEKAAAESKSQKHALAWRMAIGRFLDHIEDPSAVPHWVALATEFPDNAQVQSWALQTRSIQSDRRAQAQMIERLRQLSGPEAVTWRLVQAKWLLSGGGSGDAAAEAASLLQSVVSEAPNSLNARIMLAGSLNRLNLDDRASAQIIAAARLQPQSVDLALEAARVLQARHDFAGAKGHLDRLLTRTDLDAGTSARIGAMLARQGEDAKAIALFEQLDKQGGLTSTQLTLLAALYRRTNQPERTAALCDRLLKSPTLGAIEFVAEFHAMSGRQEEALRVLGLLDTLKLQPGEKQVVLALHHQRFGTAADTTRLWEQAVLADPKNVRARRELVVQHLRVGKLGDAMSALDAAAMALRDNEPLRELQKQKALIRWAATADAGYHPMLEAMVQDERKQDASIEALTAIQSMTPGNQFGVLGKLRLLCQRQTDHLPLQVLTVQLHLAHDRTRDAATLAAGAMAAFPTAWEPAWVASEAMAATGRWQEALAAAQQWRLRSTGDTLPPDLMIAEALLRLRRPEEASRQLAQYLPRAKAEPQRHRDLLQRHARALLALGRVDEATRFLAPLWQTSPPWRMWAVDVALQSGGSAPMTVEWLDRVAAAIPADGRAEKTRLAATWLTLAGQGNARVPRDRARVILTELVGSTEVNAEQWMLGGLLAEQEGDTAAAESAYRKALKVSPKFALANNNLAMLLATLRKDLDEAVSLAKTAVQVRPTSASFLDTLAFVQHRAGRDDDAIATAQQAVALQPDNVQWQTRLSQLLASRNDGRVEAVPAPTAP